MTLSVSVDEVLFSAPSITIDANNETVNPSAQSSNYSAARSMVADDTQGDIAFIVSGISDLAGNTIDDVTATTDASNVSFDSILPTVTDLTIASNNNYDGDNTTSLARSCDTVTVSFYTSETIQTPVSTIAQGTAEISGSETAWASSILMDETDPDGAVAFTVDYKDLAGNEGARATAITAGSDVTYDDTAPTISSVSIASNNAVPTLAKTGDILGQSALHQMKIFMY